MKRDDIIEVLDKYSEKLTDTFNNSMIVIVKHQYINNQWINVFDFIADEFLSLAKEEQ